MFDPASGNQKIFDQILRIRKFLQIFANLCNSGHEELLLVVFYAVTSVTELDCALWHHKNSSRGPDGLSNAEFLLSHLPSMILSLFNIIILTRRWPSAMSSSMVNLLDKALHLSGYSAII